MRIRTPLLAVSVAGLAALAFEVARRDGLRSSRAVADRNRDLLHPGDVSPDRVAEALRRQMPSFTSRAEGLQHLARAVLAPAASQLFARAEDYGAEVPAWVQFLTLGADVLSGSGARIEASVYGWGPGRESALIGHWIFVGDPDDDLVWSWLDDLLLRAFRTADGRDLVVQAAAIDPGSHHASATADFTDRRPGRRVWFVLDRAEARGARSPVWPRKPSSVPGKTWFMVGGNAARDWAYGSLAIRDEGARFVHFPRNGAHGSRLLDHDFFAQMTREKLVRRPAGYTEWVQDGPSFAGACWVKAYVALCGLEAADSLFWKAVRVRAHGDAGETIIAREPALTASDILGGMHQRYTPATLGGLTAVSLESGQCGVILTTAQSDDRFLLVAADLEKLISTGARYLARYHLTKVQSLKESLGSRSEVFSPDEVLK